MVDLNKFATGPTNDPNYLGYSKEFDKPRPNKTLETLFSGIADVGGMALQGYDKIQTDNLTNEVKTAADQYNAPFNDPAVAALPGAVQLDKGTAAVAAAGGTPAAPAGAQGVAAAAPNPAAMESFTNNLNRLQQAYNAGTISSTYFWTQAEALNRNLRAKYPGQRDKIDAVVQSVFGQTPANALRAQVINDMDTAARKREAATSKYETFIQSNAGYLPPDFFPREREGRPYAQTDVYEYVQRQKLVEQSLAMERANLAARSARRDDVSADAEQLAITESSTLVNNMFKSAESTSGFGDLQKQIESIQANLIKGGPGATPQQLQEINAKGALLMGKAQAAITAKLNTPLNPGSGDSRTLASILGPEKTQKIITQSTSRISQMIDLVNNKEFGLVAANSNMISALENQAMAKAMKDPTLLAANTTRRLGGGELVNHMMSRNSGFASALDKATTGFLTHLTMEMMNGQRADGTPAGTLSQAIQKAQEAGVKSPAAFRKLIQDTAFAITSDKSTDEIRVNTAKSLFSPENSKIFSQFNEKSQLQLWSALGSPQMTKAMESLKGSNPEVFQMYTTFMADKAAGRFVRVANDLQQIITDRNAQVAIQLNPTSLRFEAQALDPRIQSGQRMPTIVNSPQAQYQNSVKTKVNDLNRMLDFMEPIFKAGGYDTKTELMKLIQVMGVDVNAPKDPHFLSKAFEAVKGVMSGGDGKMKYDGSIWDGITGNPTKPASGGINLEGSNLKTGTADVKNLNEGVTKLLDSLVNAGIVDTVDVKSGYRDPARNARAGGAKASKHIDGDAIDIDISSYSDEQKAAFLEQAIANGARGIGIYPGGRSLHLDTRETPATWGYSPFGKYRGVDWSEQPEWARKALQKLFNGS